MTTEAPERPARTRAKKGEATPVTRPYVVLRQIAPGKPVIRTPVDGGDDEVIPTGPEAWEVVGTFTAADDIAAIKAAGAEPGTTHVAVSERHWNPRTRHVESVPKESWS